MTKWNQFVIGGVVAALIIAGCSKPQQTAQQALPPSSTAPAAQAPAAQTPAPEANAQAPSGQQTPQQQAAQTPAPAPAPAAPPPPPPKPATFTLPAGSSVSVRTITGLSTKTVKTGDPFEATLAKPLVVKGVVIAPKGAPVAGVVTESDSGGRVKGRASLGVDINAVETADGQRVAIHTTALQTEAKGTKKKDAAKIGIGAGIGAAIGAIAGGGTGAAIGAAAGGGGGTLLVLGTKGAPATIPSETLLNFTLSSPLKVTEKSPGSLKKPAAQ
jgi:hypothetical protein